MVVRRVLVDTGNSVNVMYEDMFVKLGLNPSMLKTIQTTLAFRAIEAKDMCVNTIAKRLSVRRRKRAEAKLFDGVTKETIRPYSAELRASGRRAQPSNGQKWLLQEPPRQQPSADNITPTFSHVRQGQGQSEVSDNTEGAETGHYPVGTNLHSERTPVSEAFNGKLVMSQDHLLLMDTDNLRVKRVNCQAVCQLCSLRDETSCHLFTECDFAKSVWGVSGLPISSGSFTHLALWFDHHLLKLDKESCCLLILLCWKTWLARNDMVWNGKASNPTALFHGTTRYLADWNNIVTGTSTAPNHGILPAQKWTKPPRGYLKLNSDAAVNHLANRMGFGWVIRNEYGQFVAAASIPGRGLFSPKEAEAMAIKEALSWLKSNGINNVQVETDALQVTQGLLQCGENSSFDIIIADINDLLRSLSRVAICYVNRTANSVAHSLAREACSLSVRQEWLSIPPSFIVNELYSDLN
nr:uncharacterized protein LOC109191080 [Ipomoea trifida]